jgi:hypothetical protein
MTKPYADFPSVCYSDPNTVRIEHIVAQLRAAGNIVLDEDLARVSPLLRKHITPNGSYFQSPRSRVPAFELVPV